MVKLESLQMDHQHLRQLLDAAPTEGRDLLPDGLAKIGILPLHELSPHVRLEALLQRPLALHVHTDLVEVLLPLTPIFGPGILADDLLGKRAPNDTLDGSLVARAPQVLVNEVLEASDKLIGVLLAIGREGEKVPARRVSEEKV